MHFWLLMNFKCVVMLNFMLHLLLRRLFKFHQAASSFVAMAAEEEDLDEPEYDFSSIFEDLEVVEPSQRVSPRLWSLMPTHPAFLHPLPCSSLRVHQESREDALGIVFSGTTGRASWRIGLSKLILMAIGFLVIVV